MVFSCVHLSLRDFQEVRNSEFLQKVTKGTKSRSFCPGSSFPSLPSVKSERMYGFGCGSAALGHLRLKWTGIERIGTKFGIFTKGNKGNKEPQFSPWPFVPFVAFCKI
jgi:hypothetical protein